MFRNDKAEILHLGDTRYRDPCAEGYTVLCFGHHPADRRLTGGTWYYKGDEQAALLLKAQCDEQLRNVKFPRWL